MSNESSPNVSRWLRQQLAGWQAAGVTHLDGSRESREPAPAYDETASMTKSAAPSPAAKNLLTKSTSPVALPQDSMPAAAPVSREARVAALQVLADAVRACTRCNELARTRTQTVFGVGNPQAKILFIGEAPGADEDEQGEPFVGKAGKLLNDVIAACRLKREEIYICNVLKCRPPENRTPEPPECANCREYLDGQLAAIRPEYIVCWGAVAAKNLLNSELTIGKLRGRFHQYQGAKVLCTYHPSYLLRNPPAKKDVWDDMKFLFADMGVDLSQKK
ncbi:MAG: uracil-DNA glycosylase [Planctomycetaceae bacterium]|nr:uracil-DNA glycosylase [Planctomycetaceae bacterium]